MSAEEYFDHAALDRDRVLPRLLASRAAEHPERPFAMMVDGPEISYGQAHTESLCWATALERLGVAAGQSVATMLPIGLASITSWVGIAWLRACEVPINTDYRGRMLSHILASSASETLVVDARWLDRIVEVLRELPALRRIILTDDVASVPHDLGVDVHLAARLLGEIDQPGTYPGPGRPRSLTLFVGEVYQFPVYHSVFASVFAVMITWLRESRDADGVSAVERGLERLAVADRIKGLLSFLAITAWATLSALGYFLPFAWMSMGADSYPRLPSYLAPPPTAASRTPRSARRSTSTNSEPRRGEFHDCGHYRRQAGPQGAVTGWWPPIRTTAGCPRTGRRSPSTATSAAPSRRSGATRAGTRNGTPHKMSAPTRRATPGGARRSSSA